MKKDFSYIAVVLDRSGSMQSVKQATISGFNEFLEKQKHVQGTARILLAQFDDEYEVVYDTSLEEAKPLTNETYVPRNMTALHDAMGKTIKDLGAKLKAMPESERPDRVIVATITDGYENASEKFHAADIAKLVKNQRDKYSWDFVFIGANQDAVVTAQNFGIERGKALTYNASSVGTQAMAASMSNYLGAVRSCGLTDIAKYTFSEEERAAVAAAQ